MCTLTVFRDSKGYVATMNRDERHDRGESPPKTVDYDDIQIAYPIDAEAGGTWFGCNSCGVSAALLNSYHNQHGHGVKSRGSLIPTVLQQGDFDAVVEATSKIDFSLFDAFHLVIIGPKTLFSMHWDGERLEKCLDSEHGWFFLTSSSVDFPKVRNYREAFFRQWAAQGHSQTVLDDIHLWQTDNKSYSIRMERAHSRSKSVCQIRYPFDIPYIFYTPIYVGP